MCPETSTNQLYLKQTNNMDWYAQNKNMIASFVIGMIIDRFVLYILRRKKTTYGDIYTYNDVYRFCGGNPMRCHGIINGKVPGIIISDDSIYNDAFVGNMIYYCGTFHQKQISPASPGHQSPTFVLNKYIDTVRVPINIFFKLDTNEYVHIGVGKRVGVRKTKTENGRRIMVYPIVFLTGDLEKTIRDLRTEQFAQD